MTWSLAFVCVFIWLTGLIFGLVTGSVSTFVLFKGKLDAILDDQLETLGYGQVARWDKTLPRLRDMPDDQVIVWKQVPAGLASKYPCDGIVVPPPSKAAKQMKIKREAEEAASA